MDSRSLARIVAPILDEDILMSTLIVDAPFGRRRLPHGPHSAVRCDDLVAHIRGDQVRDLILPTGRELECSLSWRILDKKRFPT